MITRKKQENKTDRFAHIHTYIYKKQTQSEIKQKLNQ